MRRFPLLAFVLSGLAFFGCSAPSPGGVFSSSCLQDAEIGNDKRSEINGAALSFVNILLGPKPGDAFELFTTIGKTKASREKIELLAKQTFGPFPPQNLSIQHTYLVHILGEAPKSVICATDITRPDGWVSVATVDVPEQAHVLFLADLRNNKIAFEVWLVPEQNKWMVNAFSANMATLADLDSVKLLEMAREQHAKPGHEFDATLLCFAAKETSNRGANCQLSITNAIADEMTKISVPSGLRGAPPFIWKDGDEIFKVLKIGPLAIAGKLNVIIAQEVSPWQKDDEAEAQNRKLMKFFKRQYPDYKDVFSGLIVQAKERGGNRVYGTVEEVDATK